MKVPLNSFHLNGYRLESRVKTTLIVLIFILSLTLVVKGLQCNYSKRASLKKSNQGEVHTLLVSNFVVELLSACFNTIGQFTKKVAILCSQLTF